MLSHHLQQDIGSGESLLTILNLPFKVDDDESEEVISIPTSSG